MRKIISTLRISQLFTFLILIASGYPATGYGKDHLSKSVINTSEEEFANTYTNPVGNITHIGDPYVLQYKGNYYMYATSSKTGFIVRESTNLVDWTEKGLALDKNSIGNQWGTGNFWAPEVKYIQGKFYMVYSALAENGKMKIRIAASRQPTGPFINLSPPFLDTDAWSYIDGDMFVDGKQVYLYFVKDCSLNILNGKHVSQIFVAPLNDRLTGFKSEPKLILSPDQPWEGIGSNWLWNEGPFVMRHDHRYFLFYSANSFASPDYSVGVATSETPMGTWTKYPGNPILKKDLALRVSGPGHCMVTMSPDHSEWFIVYHTHSDFDHPSGNRNMCIDRLVFINGMPKVIGPTRTPQPLPHGAKRN